jgi:hypothetical protein
MKCPKCNIDLSEADPQERQYIAETGLAGMTEQQRIQYIYSIIEALTNAIVKIKSEKNTLNQLKMANQFYNELQQQSSQIIPPLLYAVKPEFRPAFLQMLQAISQT